MPWDGTALWVGTVRSDGSLADVGLVAGGDTESIFQPEWSPLGILYFVSDRSGWWNLYRVRNDSVEALWKKNADFGRPQWMFGMTTYAFASANRIICTYAEDGTWHMASLDPGTRQYEAIALPYTEIGDVQASSGKAVFLAGSPSAPPAVVQLDLEHTRPQRPVSVQPTRPGPGLSVSAPGYCLSNRARPDRVRFVLSAHKR